MTLNNNNKFRIDKLSSTYDIATWLSYKISW